MNNESDMKRGVSSVKRHYNPSILKETDPHEGMDEIALRELVTTLRTRLAEVEESNRLLKEQCFGPTQPHQQGCDVSPELKSDLERLERLMHSLSPEERSSPVNKLTTVRQVEVCALAMACSLRAISEIHATLQNKDAK